MPKRTCGCGDSAAGTGSGRARARSSRTKRMPAGLAPGPAGRQCARGGRLVARLGVARARHPAGSCSGWWHAARTRRAATGRPRRGLDAEGDRDLVALVEVLERALREVEVQGLPTRGDAHLPLVLVDVRDPSGHGVLAHEPGP